MPRKEWTPEEKKAFGEKMRALREAKLKTEAKLQGEATATRPRNYATPIK